MNLASALKTSGAADMATDEQQRLFEKVSPAMRGSVARDVVSEYRRWILGQIADASRKGAAERLEEMTQLKERLATEFDLVIRGDEGVMGRARTEERIFLTEV